MSDNNRDPASNMLPPPPSVQPQQLSDEPNGINLNTPSSSCTYLFLSYPPSQSDSVRSGGRSRRAL